MNLRKYINIARGFFNLDAKQRIQAMFHRLADELKTNVSYDDNYSKRFFLENKHLFNDETNIRELQEKFEAFFWSKQKEYEKKVISQSFMLREQIILLQDSDLQWYTDSYMHYEEEVFEYLNKLYSRYTNDLKDVYLSSLMSETISEFFNNIEDEDEEPVKKKKYQ